jgi:hypothetical protein
MLLVVFLARLDLLALAEWLQQQLVVLVKYHSLIALHVLPR